MWNTGKNSAATHKDTWPASQIKVCILPSAHLKGSCIPARAKGGLWSVNYCSIKVPKPKVLVMCSSWFYRHRVLTGSCNKVHPDWIFYTLGIGKFTLCVSVVLLCVFAWRRWCRVVPRDLPDAAESTVTGAAELHHTVTMEGKDGLRLFSPPLGRHTGIVLSVKNNHFCLL